MPTHPNRLIIVTGELPLEFGDQHGRMTAAPSLGKIASAILAFLRRKNPAGPPAFSEIAWAGMATDKPVPWEQKQRRMPADGFTWYPIFLPEKHQRTLADGFANTVLWPLFHYFPSYVEFSFPAYEDYFDLNRQFADGLERYLRPGDTVWIHDYQLLPLAGLLRRRFPELTIGLFLHISFPSYEIFRHLPGDWQEHILKGMLGADLIGFQTSEYATLFRNCAALILNTAGDGQAIEFDNRLITTGTFPVGIEYSIFNSVEDTPSIRRITADFTQRFSNRKIVFTIDSLDYTKGIIRRIKACEHFLQRYPDYLNKVVFVFVIVPSPEQLARNAERKKLIDERISYVNGKYGSLHWQPLVYMYKPLDLEELTTLYRSCDVALLTPLRDAMNLYAKEFAASRNDEHGVLILSEFDGAAAQLTGALLVNPNDVPNVAGTIKAGLDMTREDQRRRMQNMRESVSSHDVVRWGEEFLLALEKTRERREQFQVRFFDAYSQRQLLESYRNAHKRQIFLDYDGTLMPFFKEPWQAKPGEQVLETLGLLAADPRNSICIISGRDATVLESWLGHLPIHLVAEHGAMVRYKGGSWEKIASPADQWKDRLDPVMDRYTDACPGAFIEKKNFSMVWHYRNADPRIADKAKMELYSALLELTSGLPLQVTLGKKIVEVRNKDIDKGSAVRKLLTLETSDFILAIGDDRTDEDMFRALANSCHAFTIKVGNEASHALFNIHTPQSVLSLLGALAHLR
ncbi:MAG TPA: bifunctional alpha,alpha-trehalose-phosphate synthase (UDP-forming)/trehalose-phosphatase [Puia sp.]|nr:bifunctional alpha,alpha-trehalose-phosphate synthase (UDP-forming)/trehalose-phosphatase [Puia sp.]